ncbi:MAG: hypothetical protein GY714_14060 [Desulfobacterales bacterium]|nr:hypothetical protein [Desulfobacterales bacterium]
MQLNPKTEDGKPNTDKRIEDLVTKIPNLTDPSFGDKLDIAIDELIVESQELLKNEWEKVKSESKKGDLKDA